MERARFQLRKCLRVSLQPMALRFGTFLPAIRESTFCHNDRKGDCRRLTWSHFQPHPYGQNVAFDALEFIWRATVQIGRRRRSFLRNTSDRSKIERICVPKLDL